MENLRHYVNFPEESAALFQHTNALIMGISSLEDGTFLEVNDCFLKTLNFQREEVIGKTSKELGLTFDMNRNEIRRAIESGEGIHNLDVRIQQAGKHDLWFRYFADIIHHDGMPRLFSVALDVTQEKLALIELEEKNRSLREAEKQRERDQYELELREKHLQSLLENPSGYVVYRTRLNPETGQIEVMHVSPSFVDLLGVSEEDRNDFQKWFAYVLPEDLPSLMAASEAGMRPPFKFNQVVRYMHPETGLRWLDVRATGIPFANDPELIEYANGIILDITELKKKEHDLQEALERDNESDALQSAFLANLSHEIRTPMNGIMGFTDLLQQSDLTGEQKERYIKIIQQSGERMLGTLNNLISISKIEAGQEDTTLMPVNIDAQMDYLYQFFESMAEQKGLQFSMKSSLKYQEAVVVTDREKLLAILSGLLKNALKYTKEGSVEFGCDKKGEMLEFFVRDTGIGIPADRLGAIFDRFVQADIQDKEVLEGVGLGLSIAQAYAGMLGGILRVESTLGKGTVFYCAIPYKTPGRETRGREPERNLEKPDGLKKMVFLIVEDESSSEMYLDVLLKNHAQKIYHARNGMDAVELFREHPEIEMIFMDIKLPGMNGYEATKRIREMHPKVPIIAQTAYALKGDREKAMEAGCNAYLSKPLKKEMLFRLIRRYCPDGNPFPGKEK